MNLHFSQFSIDDLDVCLQPGDQVLCCQCFVIDLLQGHFEVIFKISSHLFCLSMAPGAIATKSALHNGHTKLLANSALRNHTYSGVQTISVSRPTLCFIINVS